MPKFAISLIGMGRPEGTRASLETMLRYAPADTLIFATSNGCPATAAMFRTIAARVGSRMFVTENSTNIGFQIPHDKQFIAASNAGCEFVLIANDDVEAKPNFLNILAQPMDSDQLVAITGPEGNCGWLNHEFHGQPGSGQIEYIEMSFGLIRVSTMRQLRRSLWCPDLRAVYGEDSSLSLFVREKGYKIATAPLHVNHIRSVTVNRDEATRQWCMQAQEDNHKVNMKRWAYYLATRRFDTPIVIKREYAIGDVVLIEPIIQAIRKSRPLSPILVETRFPELFRNHPSIQQAATKITVPQSALIVDLNGAYEDRPMMHVCEAYWQAASEVITGLEPLELTTKLYPSPEDHAWAEQTMGKADFVLLATDDTNWSGKNWPAERMAAVAKWFDGELVTTVAVGSKNRNVAANVNLVGQTTLLQLAALCARAKLMVTPDSSTLHIAQAMGCPVVCLFGVTSSRFLATQGSKHAAVEADQSLPNAGIRHRVAGKTFVPGGEETMLSIGVADVIAGIKKLEVI